MLAVAVGGLLIVALFRKGIIQKWPRRYAAAAEAPEYVRNGIFGLLPMSLAILCMSSAVAAARLPSGAGYVVLLLLICFIGLILLGFWWMHKPPQFLKPEWMRTHEKGEGLGERRNTWRKKSFVSVSPLYYGISWLLLIIGFILWLVFDGPWSILIGLGIGLGYLGAMRPRKNLERGRSLGRS
ncbi:MAG: hypothetical protein AABM30_03290 [Actinomycetota bacterium]